MRKELAVLDILNLILVIVNPTRTCGFIVRGTTIGPHFKRNLGKLASSCPYEYPWSFDNGRKCCKRYSVADRLEPLHFTDSVQSCMNNEWIECSSPLELCLSFEDPYQCPVNTSVALNEGCCTASVSRWAEDETPPCRGFKITEDTPSSCCPSKMFTHVPVCADKQQRCLSNGPLPHIAKPIDPIILEEGTWDKYQASTTFIDSTCDVLYVNFWVAEPANPYFIFDLGYHIIPQRLTLRNSHNGFAFDRAVQEFVLKGSATMGPFNWVQMLADRMENPLTLPEPYCGIPLSFYLIQTELSLRYFYFDVITSYGVGPALQFIKVE